jgi:hypothetical protein
MLKRMIRTLAALQLARLRPAAAPDFRPQSEAVTTIIAQREPWLATLSASGPRPPSKA